MLTKYVMVLNHYKYVTLLARTGAIHYVQRCYSKTLSDIPSPASLPVIGNLNLFKPFGPYTLDRINVAISNLHKEFGPIVRLRLGIDIVFLFDPNDVAAVFHSEGKYPKRPLFEALLKYRRQNKDKYFRMGLITGCDDDWAYIRNLVNPLLHPEAPHQYLVEQCNVAADFVNYLKKNRDSQGVVKDLLHHLYKYTQEAIGVVCFGTRLGCFETDSDNVINKHVSDMLDSLGKTLLGFPLWKVYPTRTYRRLVHSQDALQSIVEDLVKEARRKDNQKSKFLMSLLNQRDLDERDLNLILMEIFLAGIDTTAASIVMTLYHLGRNNDFQTRAIDEVDRLLSRNAELKPDLLNEFKFLRACIKETFRLTPPIGGSARILSCPLTLSGFDIPAGTLVIGSHPVMSRTSSFVSAPDKYDPTRWLQGGEFNRKAIPSFVSLPFSFGVRSCPGRRFAEQEIMLLLLKFFQKFRCIYSGPEVDMVMRLNYIPDKPLHFNLKER